MPGNSGLDVGMIPRSLRRLFDQRDAPRIDTQSEMQTAVLVHGGRNHVVRVGNMSASGVMVLYGEVTRIGDAVTLQLLDHGAVAGHVRWVRDGRVGISFAAPLE